MKRSISYKSFCWSIGTTSFRTKDFNKVIEEQLALLHDFWELPENENQNWKSNLDLQARYYDFMRERRFVDGDAGNKPKDAREKTSGLADIGLIDEGRKLSEAGKALLALSLRNDFSSDNRLQIDKDSFIYLKQLLKASNPMEGGNVRPFLVLLYLLDTFDYLTPDEFTYLLPLCIGEKETEEIVSGIRKLRSGKISIDRIIINRLLGMQNYREALQYFLKSKATKGVICEIGLNRKSRRYDESYHDFYVALRNVFVKKDEKSIPKVYAATQKIKIGKLWRNYLFDTTSEAAIKKQPLAHVRNTVFQKVRTEKELKEEFFKVMHLFKAKATLSDYLDLNRRYARTTDIVLFEDDMVRLDILPKHFFKAIMKDLYREAYTASPVLYENCDMTDIANCLSVDDAIVFKGISRELGIAVSDTASARKVLADARYKRLQHIIDTKFTDSNLLYLLDCFERRNDAEIRAIVTDNADIPTIFEYVLGLLWYKVSEQHGKILDYMKLSLDADLLPKTHAAGGEADIVYEYEKTKCYPKHSLLIEATLADNTNQRRMEAEPVSRHLGNHLLRSGNKKSYCVFVSTNLNINVISDFRGKKTGFYYDTQDSSRYVEGMKIIPLETEELKKIITDGKTYKELYPFFEKAFLSNLPPKEWYDNEIKKKI